MSTLRLVGIAGSLRAGSFNRALLSAAADLAPDGVALGRLDIGSLPLYDQDLDTETPPASVVRLRASLRAADGLIIATPEYNHSVPGVLQNALDWASRPAFRSSLAGLPSAMMGAATSSVGTARAQEVLKSVLLSALAPVFPHRGVLVGGAAQKFAAGRLVDPGTRDFVAAFVAEFADWARRAERGKSGPPAA